MNKHGNRTNQTSPAVFNLTPTSGPIIDSSNACSQASAPVVFRCMDQSNSQLLGVLGLPGTCFLPKLPIPLRGSLTHVTRKAM